MEGDPVYRRGHRSLVRARRRIGGDQRSLLRHAAVVNVAAWLYVTWAATCLAVYVAGMLRRRRRGRPLRPRVTALFDVLLCVGGLVAVVIVPLTARPGSQPELSSFVFGMGAVLLLATIAAAREQEPRVAAPPVRTSHVIAPDAAPGLVRIYRPDDKFGMLRHLRIKVDDATVAKLLPNKTVTVAVPAGTHTFRASMDWARSSPLEADVPAGQELALKASMPGGGLAGLLTGGGPPTVEVDVSAHPQGQPE
jgi:hypothetical protein